MNARPAVVRFLWVLLLLPALAAAQVSTVSRTVTRPVLNMYSAPTLDADVVSQALYGTNVAVLEEKDGWLKIKTPADDYTGWIESEGVRARAEPYATGGNVVHVRSLFAHLYREESVTKHAPFLTVPFETKLEAAPDAGQSERWLAVNLPDGRRGFIHKADVAPSSGALSIDEALALGKRFIGLPYTWGGTSSYGYDCSGFTQMLMRQRGYLMPRDASVQAKWAGLVPVERAELKAGDLLFFGASDQRITHTGMYMGEGLFINATTHETPTVRIDNLNDPYWTKLLVAARRVKP